MVDERISINYLEDRSKQHQLPNANIDRKCGQYFTQRSQIVIIIKSTNIL